MSGGMGFAQSLALEEELVMKTIIAFVTVLVASICTKADLLLSDQSRANCVIIYDADAAAPEKFAAAELAATLGAVTGASFRTEPAGASVPRSAIVVGAGGAAAQFFPEVPLAGFGQEEIVMKSKGGRLLLAGGKPRGTVYAVSRFLQDECGVRWWTPWATNIPHKATLRIRNLDVRYKPPFEMREPFWYPAFDGHWSVRNCANGQNSKVPTELGGSVRYKGFVHTFYPLVPPEKHFTEHPEWFSEIKGKRSTDRAQLCLTNPKLRDFTVDRVKEWLRESPEASIISVSQNDWYGACECESCKALDDAEGSHSGTMLAFVNYVAEKIEMDFPRVAIDTLAYQYTRKPPKTLRPRPNVIVRLCSIECNFREPLSHSSNASFADDIRGWARICDRLYIWDYTTDFAHYVQPHPNWFTLDSNVRFFAAHNVRGVFEQGAYQSHGSEMAEMRAWVLAQLLWNPKRDGRALIREFVEGYYGHDAAEPILHYLELMHDASLAFKLTCFSKTDAPFLSFEHLAKAEKLWQQAELAVRNQPVFLERVALAHLPVRYVWLSRWSELRKQVGKSQAAWPLSSSRKQVAQEWKTVAEGRPSAPWTRVTLLNEGRLTPEKFLEKFLADNAE